MADHVEIRPDDASLPLTLADIALRNSNMRLTYLSGTIAVDNGDGTETWIGGGDTGAAMPGSNGIIPWVGDTTPPGRPTGVTAVCRTECVFVQWDGTLEGGVPADFDHVELYAKPDSTGESLDLGQLRGKGELATGVLPVGDVVEVWAVAYDNAHDVNGVSKPNASDESEHATVIIAPIVSQQDLNDTASEILDAAKSDAAAQVKKVSDGLDSARKDIDANTDAANALKSQQTQLRSDLDAAAKKIDANAQGVDAVRKQQDTADAALKSLGKTVEDNKSAQDAINAQQAETNKTIAANKTALADASKQLEQAKADIKTGQADLADARETLADNTAKLVQAQKDIAANKTAQTDLSKQLAAAKSDIKANQDSLTAANQTIAANKTALAQAQKDIAQTKSDLTTANGEISKAKESAAQAYAEAHSKNHTFRGPDEPKDNLIVGDLWLKTQKYWTRWKGEKNNSPSLLADFYTYWQGAPNNSPSVLVPLNDRVVEVLTWDGTRFEPFDLVANNILAAGTVAAKHLAADSVTAEKVKTNAITVDKLAANSVTTEKLVTDSVTAAKLAANSVQARNIVALSITSDKIAANSVTTAKLRVTEDMMVALLKAHQIQAGDIAANAVTSDNIIANAINSGKIAANAVTSDKIVTNAVTSDKILANSVTTAKLKVTEDMTVALLKAHQIQAGELTANSVTGQNIKADALYGKTIQGGVFRTSDGRMVINDAGIVAKAKSGRKRQAYYTYWQGEPNNSPSVLVTVDLADDESFVLDSQSGTVAMCGEILSGSTISGTSIVGSEFRTANSRMLLNDSGLVLRNTQGKATVTLNAASGSATFSGTVTGSTITGGTVSGAVITGSAFTSPDGKTKLNSSGFYVGDKLSYDAKSGVLSLKGSIQSGSDLSGVTVTGSTIQTSSTANRGLKLTSGGLVAYDGNGNAKFTLKSDGTIQMNGALLTNGKITAATLEGGTITGGTITGGMIQSSSAANTGFKLSGGALDFYDKSNNRTIHLNGTDNLLSGRFQTALSGPRLVLNNTTASDGSVYGLLKCYDANGVAWYTQGQSHGFNPSGQNDPGAYRRLNIGIDPSNSELSVVRFNSGASRIQMNAGRVDINGDDGWLKQIGSLGIYVNGSRIDPVVYTDLNDWFVPSSGWTAYAGDSGKDYRSHMTVIGNTCYMQLELQRSDKKSVTFNAGNYLDIGWFKEGFTPKIGLNVPCIFNNGQYGGAFVPGNTVPSTGDRPDINGDGVYLRGHLHVGARQQFTAWWVSVFMMFTI